jgi:hypothetical protein
MRLTYRPTAGSHEMRHHQEREERIHARSNVNADRAARDRCLTR